MLLTSLPQRVVGRSLNEWGRSSKRVRCVSPAILPVLPSHALGRPRRATTLRSYWAASTTSSIPPVPEDSAELDAAGRSVSGCTRAILQVLPNSSPKASQRAKTGTDLKGGAPCPSSSTRSCQPPSIFRVIAANATCHLALSSQFRGVTHSSRLCAWELILRARGAVTRSSPLRMFMMPLALVAATCCIHLASRVFAMRGANAPTKPLPCCICTLARHPDLCGDGPDTRGDSKDMFSHDVSSHRWFPRC